MAFLDDWKERSMATSVKAKSSAQIAKLKAANFFELSRGRSTISYTASNIAGKPVVTYHKGKVTRTFTGDEVRREKTALGTLVTVTLEVVSDGPTSLLTLVLPEVLVGSDGPEKVSVPVVFHIVQSSIAGPPLNPGQVQTYDVKTFTGTASFRVS
jgi:hypothetical protein